VQTTGAGAAKNVLRELPGYLLNNRVLRAALVSVAAAPDENN
jgi:molecular chaperone GrpE (heat shock protein)